MIYTTWPTSWAWSYVTTTPPPQGWYSPSLRVISTMRDMAVWDYKSTLAHELGHAVYNDRKTGHDNFDHRQEERADRFAAKLLITDDELKHLAPWHGNDFHGLAIDLEVTPTSSRSTSNNTPTSRKK